MDSFKDKLKNFFSKDTFEKAKVFCIDNKRYFGALALFIILVIVLCKFMGTQDDKDTKKDDTQKPEAVESENFKFDTEFEKDSDDAIKTLLEKYYAAYVEGDIAELEKVATPISDNEKSYITVLSKYYEKIMNITYYSKSGATEGSYFVSVRNDIKFYDVDSTAPALDFFYIETKDGNLYINNLYSIYNLTFAENSMDSDIYTLVQQYMQQDDFVELQNKVQVAYNEALAGDDKLSKMLGDTIDKAIREWAASIKPSGSEATEAATEQTTEKDKNTETPSETNEKKNTDTEKPSETNEKKNTDTQTPSETDKNSQTPEDNNNSESTETNDNNASEPEKTTSKVKTIDIVNVRAGASSDAELLGKLTDGVVLTKLGEDGEWTIVEYSGGKDGKGYIKTEFLEAVK